MSTDLSLKNRLSLTWGHKGNEEVLGDRRHEDSATGSLIDSNKTSFR